MTIKLKLNPEIVQNKQHKLLVIRQAQEHILSVI